jgi:hypothetical protein
MNGQPYEGRLYIAAQSLTPGSVIIERTDRGNIRTRATVQGTMPCGDAANVHATVSVNGKIYTWCYFGAANVEVKNW